jgi:hypothetical protein
MQMSSWLRISDRCCFASFVGRVKLIKTAQCFAQVAVVKATSGQSVTAAQSKDVRTYA